MTLEAAGAKLAMRKQADNAWDHISTGLNAASWVPGIGNVAMPIAGAYDAARSGKEGDLLGAGTALAGGTIGLAMAGEGGQATDEALQREFAARRMHGMREKPQGAWGKVNKLIEKGDAYAGKLTRPILGKVTRGLNKVSPTASRGFVRGMRWMGQNPMKSFIAAQLPAMLYAGLYGEVPKPEEQAKSAAELEKAAIAPMALAAGAMAAYGLYGAYQDLKAGNTAWGLAQIPLSLAGGTSVALKGLGKAVPFMAKAAPKITKFMHPVEQGLKWGGGKMLAPIARGAEAIGAKGVGKYLRSSGAKRTAGLMGAFTAGSMLFGGEGGGGEGGAGGNHQENPLGIQPNLGNVQNVAPDINLMRQTQQSQAGQQPPMPFQQPKNPQMWGQQSQQPEE